MEFLDTTSTDSPSPPAASTDQYEDKAISKFKPKPKGKKRKTNNKRAQNSHNECPSLSPLFSVTHNGSAVTESVPITEEGVSQTSICSDSDIKAPDNSDINFNSESKWCKDISRDLASLNSEEREMFENDKRKIYRLCYIFKSITFKYQNKLTHHD